LRVFKVFKNKNLGFLKPNSTALEPTGTAATVFYTLDALRATQPTARNRHEEFN